MSQLCRDEGVRSSKERMSALSFSVWNTKSLYSFSPSRRFFVPAQPTLLLLAGRAEGAFPVVEGHGNDYNRQSTYLLSTMRPSSDPVATSNPPPSGRTVATQFRHNSCR